MVSAGACVVCADQQPPAPGTILTVAGKGGQPGFSGDGGPATQARLSQPLDIAFDEAGDLFIDDTLNACIRRVGPDGTITTVVGAGGRPGFSGDGGPAAMARLQNPIGLAFDAAGAFFFTDADNLRVRKVDAARIISTVAGGGHPAAGLGDGGPATAARLVGPTPAGPSARSPAAVIRRMAAGMGNRPLTPICTVRSVWRWIRPATCISRTSWTIASGE
jgi:hypothetical protein